MLKGCIANAPRTPKGERGISGVRGALAERRRIRTNYLTEAARAACDVNQIKAKLDSGILNGEFIVVRNGSGVFDLHGYLNRHALKIRILKLTGFLSNLEIVLLKKDNAKII